MCSAEFQLIFTGLFVFTMRLSRALPVELSVAQLLSETQDKLGLVKYFNDQHLDKICDHSVLDDTGFKNLEPDNPVPCLCTVIYNVTIELENSGISILDVNNTITQTTNNTSNSLLVYNVWKNVAKISPPLKLLMDPLDDLNKWQIVCSAYYSLSNLSRLCHFLNVEVLLLNNSTQKQSIESTDNNISKSIPEPLGTLLKPEEQNKPDDLPETNPKAIPPESGQSTKNEISISDKEPSDTINKDNESIDDQVDKYSELATEPKSVDKLFNDNPKEDYEAIQTESKETPPILSQKNVFAGPEETHFLFYFSIMTLLSMLFYLALYNKKKIIALVIEGRRSTNHHRRRPNTMSYSKVETDEGSTVF